MKVWGTAGGPFVTSKHIQQLIEPVPIEQGAVAAADELEAVAHAPHRSVAQRHRLPGDRADAFRPEDGLGNLRIGGACPPAIYRPEHFDETASALEREANVRCRLMMDKSIAEAEQRVDAIMEKRIDRREDGYRAARRFAAKGNGSEALAGYDEAEIKAFLSRSGADRIDGDRCRDQAWHDYRRQNDCRRIDSGAPEDVGVRGG